MIYWSKVLLSNHFFGSQEEEVRAAREREEASDKRLQQLQTNIKQLDLR